MDNNRNLMLYCKGKSLPEDVRKAAIDLYSAGSSTIEIANSLHISAQSVRNLVKLYSDSGNLKTKTKSGRPRSVTTETVCTRVEFYLRRKPSTYNKEIRTQLVNDGICFHGNAPSATTIAPIIVQRGRN